MTKYATVKKGISISTILVICLMVSLAVLAVLYLKFRKESVTTEYVENMPLTIQVDTEKKQAYYTGDTKDDVPAGIGTYRIDDWTFTGFAYSNGMLSGTVENMPFTVNLGGTDYATRYTGKITNCLPTDDGLFIGEGWTFDGSILNGVMTGEAVNAPVPVETATGTGITYYTGTVTKNGITEEVKVKDAPCIVTFQKKEYTGTFTGVMKLGKPEGEGSFRTDPAEKEALLFEGTFSEGAIRGPGTLIVDSFALNGVTGDFEGTVDQNGLPTGEGRFVYPDENGNTVTYSGSFAEGKYDGQGSLISEDAEALDLVGTFSKGTFTPTMPELICALGSGKSESFTLTDDQKAYIEKYQDMFLNGSKKYLTTVRKGFTVKNFISRPDSYKANTFMVKQFISTVETKELYGQSFMIVNGRDPKKGTEFRGYFFGTDSTLRDGADRTVIGYPLAVAEYTDKDGKVHTVLEYLLSYTR